MAYFQHICLDLGDLVLARGMYLKLRNMQICCMKRAGMSSLNAAVRPPCLAEAV